MATLGETLALLPADVDSLLSQRDKADAVEGNS